MSNLNEVAVQIGMRGLGMLDEKIIDLDLERAKADYQFGELRKKTREAESSVSVLYNQIRDAEEGHLELRRILRDLKQSRDGFPHLTDEGYESVKKELRERVQEIVESL